MAQIDENQEAIAGITMAVDLYDASQRSIAREETENDGAESPPAIIEGEHWKLGAPLKRISARDWELLEGGNAAFRCFETRLTAFLAEYLPHEDLPASPIMVSCQFL